MNADEDKALKDKLDAPAPAPEPVPPQAPPPIQVKIAVARDLATGKVLLYLNPPLACVPLDGPEARRLGELLRQMSHPPKGESGPKARAK